MTREEIHKSMTSLRFLDVIMRFLKLEVSIDFEVLFLPFYKMSFMNKLEFSSFIISLYGFLKPWGSFLPGFPPFDAFLIVVSMRKIRIYP